MCLIDKLNLFINENMKDKDEAITTVSAGVPGEGPIADVQNGLTITNKDKKAIKKNKKLLKSVGFNESTISINELLEILDIEELKKKYVTFDKIWKYVLVKLEDLSKVLKVNLSNSQLNKLKLEIKKLA